MSHGKPVIGIVVITVPGGNVCMDQIAKTLDHPIVVSVTRPFSAYKPAVETKNWHLMASLILENLQTLHRAGATFAIIPSNTPHYAYDLYAPSSPIPVLNILDISVAHCETKGYRKVAVLGTKQTMADGLYSKKLEAKGIEAVVPEPEIQLLLHRLIMDELVPKGDKADAAFVLEMAIKLRTISCDAFILGCTELPIVFTPENLGKPVIDTTRLLGDAAIFYARVAERTTPVSDDCEKHG